MSTHDTDIGKDQLQPSQPLPQPPSPPPGARSNRWIISSVLIVVALLVISSIGIVLLVQQGQHPGPQGTPTPVPTTTIQPTSTTPPLTGQWISVLTDYKITSLEAAPSNPNVLYACAVPPGLAPELAGVQTVLRSVDFGTHWENLAAHAQLSRGCQLTISPTDSNDVYVATSSAPATDPQVPSYALKHTTDGGTSWETFQPTVHGPGLQIPFDWRGEQLGAAGNSLFSLQMLPIPPMPTPVGHQGPLPTEWTRLVMSTDGGHTWGVLDSQFYKTWQSAWTYTVNPTNTNSIYEIVGLPGAVAGGPYQAELFKSGDGGTTWQPVLKQLPTIPTDPIIFIGSENSNFVYLTNTRCPSTQAFHAGGGPLFQPLAGAAFSVCMSSDGGAHWQTITAPSQLAVSMGGVIDPQGRLYAYTPSTPGSVVMDIWRYDPSVQTWSKVTTAPMEWSLLRVTPSAIHGHAALWLMGIAQEKLVLYRYGL